MEKHIEKLEKELHHHESLGMKEAHHKHGGKIHHKASGGAIDRDEIKTTIEHDEKPFVKTKVVDADHADKHHGTGEIKEKNAGGFKRGGKVHHKFAKGGSIAERIPADSKKGVNSGKIEMGGTIEGNEHYYEDTDMHTQTADKGGRKTGQVDMSNAGGFRHGGKAHHKMHHKASGGAIEKYETRNTIDGGDWENRSADTAKPGKRNTHTGEVKEANAGGYKRGGHATKKAYATGGNVNSVGRPVAMPKKALSQPVANSLQSGTFKKGGHVKHFYDGDSVRIDPTPSNSTDTRGEKLRRGGKVHHKAEGGRLATPQAVNDPAPVGSSKSSDSASMRLATPQAVNDPAPVSRQSSAQKATQSKKHGGRAR
jgi:hypothetical protein